MADAAAVQQASATEVAPSAPTAPVVDRGAARAERRANAIAKLQASNASAPAAPESPAKPATEPAATAPAKPAEPPPEKPDPATDRGLRTVEQARKKFLDEQNAAKAELEVQRAEIARLRKEAEGRVASRDELKKLKPTELLEVLEHFTEDDHDILSRAAYARTKAGKTDPRAQAAAQEAARSQTGRAAAAEVASLKEQHAREIEELRAELRGEFTKRDQASFAERWVGEAVKAIPTDKPTFLSKLHTNDPKAAQRELLMIGAELEKANDGEPPTQAEVIAEFENRKRASLKALGLDPDALLSPPKPAEKTPAAKPAARTLDVAAANVTRPANAPKTREERRANAIANLHARQRATADQT